MSGGTHKTGRASDANDKGSSSANEDDLSDRLETLGARLEQSRQHHAPPQEKDNATTRKGVSQALRLSSEFVAGVVVGGALGYGIDVLAGTSPFGMIVFFLLGFVAAVLNVMRAAGMVSESNMRVHLDSSKKPPE